MEKLKVVQKRSSINCPLRQKRTLKALGITKMNRPIIVNATPQILGMINKLNHMLTVEKV